MAWFQPKPLTVPDIIALNAGSLHGKTAWVDRERRVSWTEFGAGTSRVANALAAAGLEKGDRVVVLMKNSYEMAEAMFGIIRGGYVAVPLNVSISDAAVAGMIANSAARAVFASDVKGEFLQQVVGTRVWRLESTDIADEAQPGGRCQ